MAQTNINNGDSGLVARNKINNQFIELYGAIVVPVKITGISGNSTTVIPANTYLTAVSIIAATGTPTLRIGLTPNGQEIMPDVVINTFVPVLVNTYYGTNTTIYFTFSGSIGSVNIRFDVLNNYF